VCGDDETIIIIDAGTGIRKLGQELMTGPCGEGKGDVHLLISHTHWDHIQGIPFFAPLYVKGNRINIYAYKRDVHLQTIFSSQSEAPYFPISLEEVAAEVNYIELVDGSQFKAGPVGVRCVLLNHPFMALGYRLEHVTSAMAYVSDTAPFDRIIFGHTFIARRPDLSIPLSSADASRLKAMRRAVTELCRECDAIIYDTMFGMEEYLSRPHWGHSCTEHALEIAHEAHAASLILFHHSPERTDDEIDRQLSLLQNNTSLKVMAAMEGMILELLNGVRRV
jgi:phosphoribosyl 1,2-cyclic phosphodiesterase